MAEILIVDDDASIRETLQALLERMGHRVIAAEDGIQAVQRFDQAEFDVIVSDVMMPEMNGFDLLQTLQSRILDRVPFVILSSHDDREAIKAALFAGAFDYILKPFDEDRIGQVVERALTQRAAWSRGDRPPTRQAPIAFAPPPPAPPPSTCTSFASGDGPDVFARSTKVVRVAAPSTSRGGATAKGPGRWFRGLFGRRG